MGKIKENFKKQERKIICYILRKYYLKKITRGYGKITEEEDRIICHVSQKVLEKNKKDTLSGHDFLFLHGVNFIIDDNKDIIDILDLNKEVYYIFDNIEFKNGLTFYSNQAHVLFKNCKFYRWINIPTAHDVLFENNKYFSRFLIRSGRDAFFYACCKNLKFKNDHFYNSDIEHHPTKFGLNIEADTLEFNNTKIDSERPGNIEIKANKTIISNSKINGSEIYLDSKEIDYLNSSMTAKKGIVIENSEFNSLKNMNSPIIVYNDTIVSPLEEKVVDKEKVELKQKRKEIVQKLYNIKNYCELKKQESLKKYEQNFDNKTINKILKKM